MLVWRVWSLMVTGSCNRVTRLPHGCHLIAGMLCYNHNFYSEQEVKRKAIATNIPSISNFFNNITEVKFSTYSIFLCLLLYTVQCTYDQALVLNHSHPIARPSLGLKFNPPLHMGPSLCSKLSHPIYYSMLYSNQTYLCVPCI